MKIHTLLLSLSLAAGPALGAAERPEDRWNLADLYPTLEAGQADAARVESQLKDFSTCRGRLGESARRLKACLDAFADFSRRFARLEVFRQERVAQDTG